MLGAAMNRALSFSVFLLLTAAFPASGALVFKSGATPARLLEVYTSEGCASCPPADAWLGEMTPANGLWTSVVPVAWHVDYWDRQGWRDVLGSRNYSIRQKSEAGAASVTTYTPGFFLNGAEWRGFFDGNPLPPSDGPNPGLLRVTQTAPREFIVEFTPTGACDKPMDIYGALLGMEVAVDVSSGENRGKKLVHNFAVLGSTSKKVESHNGTYTVRLALSNFTTREPARKAAAFWVAPAGGFAALQATGGFLAEELPDGP